MSLLFEPTNIASRDALEAERTRLSSLIWPARALALILTVVAFWVAHEGAKSLVPVIACWIYNQDIQEWPKIAFNFIETMQIVILYIATFCMITVGILRAFIGVLNTHVFTPYWRLSVLELRDKEEVLRLAENWPAVEAYRLAVAVQRDFLRGDLEVMQSIADQAEEEARQENINQRLVQTDLRLHQGHPTAD